MHDPCIGNNGRNCIKKCPLASEQLKKKADQTFFAITIEECLTEIDGALLPLEYKRIINVVSISLFHLDH